jgi:hypothetical protein
MILCDYNFRRHAGMPNNLKIATAQFEHRSGDKEFNLASIESARAALLGADVVAFHECSVTGYSFARRLSKEQMWELAEVIPSGKSTATLTEIARRHGSADPSVTRLHLRPALTKGLPCLAGTAIEKPGSQNYTVTYWALSTIQTRKSCGCVDQKGTNKRATVLGARLPPSQTDDAALSSLYCL